MQRLINVLTSDDDEISIDFSKITKFFKSNKKKDTPKDDDEISLDLSGVKKFFSSSKKSKNETTEDDAIGNLDYKTILSYGKQHAIAISVFPCLPCMCQTVLQWLVSGEHCCAKRLIGTSQRSSNTVP